MLQAVIDVGGNNVRLVVYDVVKGSKKIIHNEKRGLKLINHITKDNNLAEKKVDELIDTLNHFKNVLLVMGITNVAAIATSVLGFPHNTDQIMAEVVKETGFTVKLIGPEDEARYGAVAQMRDLRHIKSAITLDLGGGSAVLTHYDDEKILNWVSLDLGTVLLYKKYVKGDRPTFEEYVQITNYVLRTIEKVEWLKDVKLPLILIGGNARNLGLMHKDLKAIKGSPHGYEMSIAELKDFRTLMTSYSIDELYALKNFDIERKDIILPALQTFETIAEYIGATTLIISQSGITDGVLQEITHQKLL